MYPVMGRCIHEPLEDPPFFHGFGMDKQLIEKNDPVHQYDVDGFKSDQSKGREKQEPVDHDHEDPPDGSGEVEIHRIVMYHMTGPEDTADVTEFVKPVEQEIKGKQKKYPRPPVLADFWEQYPAIVIKKREICIYRDVHDKGLEKGCGNPQYDVIDRVSSFVKFYVVHRANDQLNDNNCKKDDNSTNVFWFHFYHIICSYII
jgi:hypothetical protein